MKEALRREMRRILRLMDEDARRSASAAAQERLMQRPEFRKAKRIALYCHRPEETATDRLIAACRTEGRILFVPAWQEKEARYSFSLWDPGDPLVMGPLTILQPAHLTWVLAKTMDLIVVPGLAFDRWGGRLGRGKGFYDRLLAEADGVCKVGFCFRWQICDRIRMEPHDVRVDWVVTDEAVHRGGGTVKEKSSGKKGRIRHVHHVDNGGHRRRRAFGRRRPGSLD